MRNILFIVVVAALFLLLMASIAWSGDTASRFRAGMKPMQEATHPEEDERNAPPDRAIADLRAIPAARPGLTGVRYGPQILPTRREARHGCYRACRGSH